MGEPGSRPDRSPRPRVDPWQPLDLLLEEEPDGRGGAEPALTVFLAGAECPFGCVYCDLWRHTLDGPTPPGAIPRQLEITLERLRGGLEGPTGVVRQPAELARLKLYNASNFFEERAVPAVDDGRILELLAPFREVTVECHPRLVRERALAFAARLPGRLEVAMGLETVHPRVLPKLGKRMTLADFERALDLLRRNDLGARAFVLVGVPFVPPEEGIEWAVRSARWAFERGVQRVSLIPVRGGTAEMERLRRSGDWAPPTLEQLEAALDETVRGRGEIRDLPPLAKGVSRGESSSIATADLWDLEVFSRCPECLPARRERLRRINFSGRPEPRVACTACEGA